MFRAGKVSAVKRSVQSREVRSKRGVQSRKRFWSKLGVQSRKSFWSKKGCSDQGVRDKRGVQSRKCFWSKRGCSELEGFLE